jgi:serine/threonine protein kinase
MSLQGRISSTRLTGTDQASAIPQRVTPHPFGPYILLARLSVGRQSESFLAVHRSSIGFEKLVVLKRNLRTTSAAGSIPSLLHEARAMMPLSHPNVVQTFDAGEIDGLYFLAMEHVAGPDTSAVLEAARRRGLTGVPLEHALTIALAACAALTYVHEKCDATGIPLGIVHGALCTRNLIVTFAGDVKLVELGVATSGTDERDDTRDVMLEGRAGSMSPEQVRGEAPDLQTDIYALGIVLYELTTGRQPFAGRSGMETLTLLRDGRCARPGDVVRGYPPALEHIVTRAMQKRREDRYGSARAMQADVERFVRERSVAVSTAALGSWIRLLLPERLAQELELVRAVPQLAQAAPAQPTETPAGDGPSGRVSTSMAPVSRQVRKTAAGALLPPLHWMWGVWGIAAGGAFVVLCTVLVIGRRIEREMAARTNLLRAYHDEQALRAASARESVGMTGTLELTSIPPGCAVWINGTQRSEVTPVTIDKLLLDRELHIKLAKDGFEEYRAIIRLTGDTPFEELKVEMKPAAATVVVHAEPPSAAVVWLDGKPWRGDAAVIDGLTSGVEHRITVAAPGYVARIASVTALPGETKDLAIRLVRASSSSP